MFIIKKGLYVCLCLLIHSSLFASDLVDNFWLKANAHKIKIIDLRSMDKFLSGHIPNSINIPYKHFTRKKNNIDGFVERPMHFKSVMEMNGIKNDDVVVLYSDWSFLDSMRIYWVMDFYGHQSVKVLDGGLQSWISENELSNDETYFEKSQYVIEVKSEIITTKFRTFMATKNTDYIIVDGREPSQYRGEKSLTERYGHIPSAINLPWVELVKNRKASHNYNQIPLPTKLENFKIIKERLGIIPKEKKIILYCNGGQESSVLYFALKELGVRASVYDGSWFEWSSDNKMPVIDKTKS